MHAVIRQVESPIQRRRLRFPGAFNQRDGILRNPHPGVQLVVDDVLRGGERHLLEFVGGGLQHVHLLGRELIERRFVPIRLLAAVPCEAPLFYFLFPIRPRCRCYSSHNYSPAPAPAPDAWPAPVVPNPPRSTPEWLYDAAGSLRTTPPPDTYPR